MPATTVPPSAAIRLAVASPMPLPAPVTSATFPSKRFMVFPFLCMLRFKPSIEGRSTVQQDAFGEGEFSFHCRSFL